MKYVTVLVFAGVLTVFGWLAWRGIYGAWLQHEAESFPQVDGTVTATEVTTTHGSRGGTYYHAHISYRYPVDGTEYQGWRYRYDGHPTDQSSVEAIIAAHPKNSEVEVYYNPENPGSACLSPGVDRSDVGLPFLMLASMGFLLYVLLSSLWQNFTGKNKVAGGVVILSEMMVTRVRLPRFQPLILGVATFAGLAGLSAILVAAGAIFPPWTAGEWSLAGMVAGGLAVYGWQRYQINSGRQDLVIDEGSRTLVLPLTYKRREAVTLPWSQVQSVRLNPVKHQRKGGAYYTYMVTLERRDESQERLVDLNEERAKAFAGWLREKLGMPEQQ